MNRETLSYDYVVGQISPYLPNDLFDKLFTLPANTSLEELKHTVEITLPKEYAYFQEIMDILNKALS